AWQRGRRMGVGEKPETSDSSLILHPSSLQLWSGRTWISKACVKTSGRDPLEPRQGDDLLVKGLVVAALGLAAQNFVGEDIVDADFLAGPEILASGLGQAASCLGGIARLRDLVCPFFPLEEGIVGIQDNEVSRFFHDSAGSGTQVAGALDAGGTGAGEQR